MTDPTFQIDDARIDVPLQTATHAYLFVSPDQINWDPWWGSLFRHLVELASGGVNWRHEPVQDVYVARPKLTDERRVELVEFLRSAPPHEIATHRTLRRAVALTAEQVTRLGVVYFSSGMNQAPGAKAGS